MLRNNWIALVIDNRINFSGVNESKTLKTGANKKKITPFNRLVRDKVIFIHIPYLGLGFCSGGNILSAPSSSFFTLPAIENRVIFLKT
jgi:hypothetical protein